MDSVEDGLILALLAVLAISSLQLCVKSVRVTVSHPTRLSSNGADERSDIEASLLEHVGGSHEELSIAVHPRRTALRILYPLNIFVASFLCALALTEQVQWLASHALRLLGPSHQNGIEAFDTVALARALLVLGWGSQVVALVKARTALVIDPRSSILRTEISVWSLAAMFYYMAMGAVYEKEHAAPCIVGALMSLASVVLEAMIVYGGPRESGDEQEQEQSNGRRREKSWVLLLGAAITYVWPNSFHLRVRAVLCLLLVVCIRVLNIAVPYAYKKVVDSFSSADNMDGSTFVPFGTLAYPWVVLYLGCSLLQGGAGGGTVGLLYVKLPHAQMRTADFCDMRVLLPPRAPLI